MPWEARLRKQLLGRIIKLPVLAIRNVEGGEAVKTFENFADGFITVEFELIPAQQIKEREEREAKRARARLRQIALEQAEAQKESISSLAQKAMDTDFFAFLKGAGDHAQTEHIVR